METKNSDAIYRGIWPGLGKVYNIRVDAGQTTITLKPGEDLELRAKQTQEKHARKDIPILASAKSF
jgi:hypothetical protein